VAAEPQPNLDGRVNSTNGRVSALAARPAPVVVRSEVSTVVVRQEALVDRSVLPPVDSRALSPVVRKEAPPLVRSEAPPIVRREASPVVRNEAGAGRSLADFDPAFDGKLVVTADATDSAIEQYDRLAETLVRWQVERGAKTIMISSALPREGRTLTVTNLALTLSERRGQHVLLVDADLASPSIHEIFELSNATGLSDSLHAGRVHMPVVEVSSRLTVLPAGPVEGDPMETLVSNGMRTFILESAPRFDWVLLDTPAVSMVTDPHLLAWLCDGVLLVVGAGATSCRVVEQAIADLGVERVIGTVLNRAGRPPGANRNGSKATATGRPSRTFLVD
jgi:capsular exopolysaccharide synthesis family protein